MLQKSHSHTRAAVSNHRAVSSIWATCTCSDRYPWCSPAGRRCQRLRSSTVELRDSGREVGRRTLALVSTTIFPRPFFRPSQPWPGAQRQHTVPRILHDPPADLIFQRRFPQPRPDPLVLRPSFSSDHLPCDPKLCAATGPHNVRHHAIRSSGVREQVQECGLVRLFGGQLLARVLHVDLVRTAQRPDAAQVDIAGAQQMRVTEARQHGGAVVVGVVVVPLVLSAVDEEDRWGQGVVVVDHVAG